MRNRVSPYRLEVALRGLAWRHLLHRVERVLNGWAARRQADLARTELEARSDRELSDLGILRFEIRQVLRRPRLSAPHGN
ncbi:MAG: DUF1127 domain-containing protein [Burkholderiaceae bacterium]|jgi:uncharacterized protein YjiS (DUF1127 family)|nr:DUF1127 domain-containing protein [Burkholderiaceae bacterium]